MEMENERFLVHVRVAPLNYEVGHHITRAASHGHVIYISFQLTHFYK